jgi:hypothetical protein
MFFRILWLKIYGECEVRRLMPKIGRVSLRRGGRLPLLQLSYIFLLVVMSPGGAEIHGTLSKNPTKTHYFKQYIMNKRINKKG